MKRPIIIKQNGKVTKIDETVNNIDSTSNETAATLQESNEEDEPVLKANPKLQKIAGSKKMKKYRPYSRYKPVIIAISSAIVIGCVLSIIMFQVFVNVETGFNDQAVQSIPALSTNNKQDSVSQNEETKMYSIDPIQGYILQTGVFSEQENAETWAQQFEEFPTITWPRGDQYFLISGIAPSKETANQLIESLLMQNEEYFIKEWMISPDEIELTEDEFEWFQTFQKSLVEAIQKVSGKEEGALDEIKTLSSIQSEKLGPLVEKVKTVNDSNTKEIQQSLLELLYLFETIE